MPGVLMLEAMVQSAAWLVRATEDFAHGMVVLAEARNISYRSFVAPGQTLEVTAEAIEIGERQSEFKAAGRRGEEEVVKARLKLRHYRLTEQGEAWADVERKLIAEARKQFELLGGPSAMQVAVSANRGA